MMGLKEFYNDGAKKFKKSFLMMELKEFQNDDTKKCRKVP